MRNRAETLVEDARTTQGEAQANRTAYVASVGTSTSGEVLDFDAMVRDQAAAERSAMGTSPRFIAFASLSMPEASLKALVQDMARAGGVTVLRGFPEGNADLFKRRLASIWNDGTDTGALGIDPENIIPATRRPLDQRVQQGELCFAFGSPFDFRFSMSSGIVSGLGRFVGMYWRTGRRIGFENFIQVDAAINPGNPGGPLTDHRGHVIGMNTAIATNDDDGQFGGIGLAIPLDMIESAANQLIESGVVRKGFLGVSVLDQNDLIARIVGAPQRFRGDGVLVHALDGSHPAAKVGLRIGDVITNYDEEPVATVDDLDRAIRQDEDLLMELRIWRYADEGSDWEDLVVTRTNGTGRIGFDVIAISERIGDLHRARGYTRRGVVIASTQQGMPARSAGMEPGDVVHRVNGVEVQSVRQLQSSISSIPPGQTATVQAWRFDDASNEWKPVTFEIELSQLQ